MNRFQVGETVFYKDSPYVVMKANFGYHGPKVFCEYDIRESTHYPNAYTNISESDLVSLNDWMKQNGSQNAIGRAAHMSNQNNVPTWQTGQATHLKVTMVSGKPKCVCGAHSLKDARHSSWCDIKN